jgi:hypothetical protein
MYKSFEKFNCNDDIDIEEAKAEYEPCNEEQRHITRTRESAKRIGKRDI